MKHYACINHNGLYNNLFTTEILFQKNEIFKIFKIIVLFSFF